MCNDDCPEVTPCCLCKWNRDPYHCKNAKCGTNCQQEAAMQAEAERMYEIPEPPYEYVEIVE